MPKKLDKQTEVVAKRIADGDCTKLVLKTLDKTGQGTAESISSALKIGGGVLTEGDKFYLKGGNSVSLLGNTKVEGDWDFQLSLKPGGSVYSEWETRGPSPLETLKEKLIKKLWEAAVANLDTSVPGITEKGAAVKAALEGDEFKKALNKNLKSISVEVVKVEKAGKKIEDRSYEIGEYYRTLTESGVQTHKDYVKEEGGDGQWRIDMKDHLKADEPDLDKDYTVVKKLPTPSVPPTFHDWIEPCVYLNSGIPGFLLFRLALLYNLKVKYKGEEQNLPMKSELIDISIPRLGGAESLLPTTYVTDLVQWSDPSSAPARQTDIKIPGWRYHMFENIMLLTEIKLKISGSPHKEAKRKTRAAQALINLKKLNSGNTDGGFEKFHRLLNNTELKEHKDVKGHLESYAGTYVNELTRTSLELDSGGALAYKNNLERKLRDINHLLSKEKEQDRFNELSAFMANFHADENAFPKIDALLSIIGALLSHKSHGDKTMIVLNYICSAYVWVKMAKLKKEDAGKVDELRFSQNAARFALDPSTFERVKKNYLETSMKGSIDTLAIKQIDSGDDAPSSLLIRQNSFSSAPSAADTPPERLAVKIRNDFARNKETVFTHVSLMKRDPPKTKVGEERLIEGAKEELKAENVKKFLPEEFKTQKKVYIMKHEGCVEHLKDLLKTVSILGIRFHLSRLYSLLLKSKTTQP